MPRNYKVGLLVGLLFLLSPAIVPLASAAEQPAATPAGGGIQVAFDFDAARAGLDVLSGQAGADVAEIAKLTGNRRLIEQAARFDPTATTERFVATLREAASGKTPSPDPFAFGRTKDRLRETRALLEKIEADPDALAAAVRARIARYTPPDLKFRVTVYVVAGGTSDGFARNDTFCVALDYFRDDMEGLKLLMAHELFHIARSAMVKRAGGAESSVTAPNFARAVALLDQTMNEGVASRVGDPLETKGGGSYVDWFRKKFQRNLERLDADFALFDTILYRDFHDPGAPADLLYRIGFSGTWDSPLYFVGYEVARVVEEAEGAPAVTRCLSRGPICFFEKYLELSRRRPDRVKHRFASSTEGILEKLRR